MRYRALSATGDYTFGRGSANFLVNSPQCVAQAVKTRLGLFQGEWFLDQTDGTPWFTQILSANLKNTMPLYDQAIRTRVLETPGVIEINTYSSSLDPTNRALSVDMTITTQFSATPIQVTV